MAKEDHTPTPKLIWLISGGAVFALLVASVWSSWFNPPPVKDSPVIADAVPAKTMPVTTTPAAPAFTNNEDAIAAAFARFADEQEPNGSWLPATTSKLAEPEAVAVTETTALVLLAFQSAGQTHKSGSYKDVVRRGHDFLLNNADLNGSTHRSQALTTLALVELYSSTHDEGLKGPAQLAINQVCESQHIPSGAWLHSDGTNVPNEIIYWQFLAMSRTHMANLNVSVKNIQALERWFHAQAKSTDPKHWDAGLLLGLRACGTYRLSELEPHYDALSESSFERLNLDQKYFAAVAFGSCPFVNSHTGLKRLGDQVRSHIHHADIGQAALSLMILKVCYPKLIFGQAAAEDDFPL